MKITLCGSIAFIQEMLHAQTELANRAHEVKIPELAAPVPPEFGGDKTINFAQHIERYGGIDAFPPGHIIWDLKEGGINDHYGKIDWCDAILVVNPEKRGIAGYVGGNTLIEIGVAFYLKKKIYILHPVSSEISYKQEILGMKPAVLNGDLSLIQ